MENFRHYQISRKLGDAPSCETYLAWDSVGERQVVIKKLSHSCCQDEDQRARCRDFIEKLDRIESDRIAKYIALEKTEGSCLLIRDYIEGESVAELIANDFNDYRRFLKIARQTATALKAAHDLGLLHENICPNNLIVSKSNQVTLVDFYPVRHEESDDQKIYHSPEQLAGSERTPQSDFYSLGVIWHQLLMGHLHFHAKKRLEPGPGHSRRLLPPEARLLLEKLLAEKPSERFASAEELLSTLREMAAVSYRVAEETGRKKKQMTPRQKLGISILVLLLIFYWWLISFYQR